MKYVAIIGAILVLIALMFVSPLLTIASLNTLFGLNIAYTFSTYLSVMWLNITTFGGLSVAIRSLKKD